MMTVTRPARRLPGQHPLDCLSALIASVEVSTEPCKQQAEQHEHRCRNRWHRTADGECSKLGANFATGEGSGMQVYVKVGRVAHDFCDDRARRRNRGQSDQLLRQPAHRCLPRRRNSRPACCIPRRRGSANHVDICARAARPAACRVRCLRIPTQSRRLSNPADADPAGVAPVGSRSSLRSAAGNNSVL